jgi:trehalose/maltose transport system substrate-binding protein
VSIDVIWSAMLGQYLMDLKPYFAAELSSQNPAVLSSYTVGDKVVAIPHHDYVGVLFYRPDLLQRYGYHGPPSTWDELEKMSRKIQSAERARGVRNFWGYVWQGGVDEDLTCSGLEWQVSDGGGRIIEEDRTISINNPQTVKTWERASHWVGSISPPAVVAYSKWDAQNVWGSGRAAFLRGWASNYSMTTGGWPFPQPGSHTVPDQVKQFGVTSMPGGKLGRVSALGGNGLAVSQSSTHPREAMQLIRFLMRRDQELIRRSMHFEVPKEVTFYELPITLNPYPKLGEVNQHGGVLVARPSVVAGAEYEKVTRAYIEALHSVLSRKKAASVSAAELERDLINITGFAKGQPPK